MAKKTKTEKKGLVELGIGIVSLVAADAISNAMTKLEKEGKLNKKEAEKAMKEAVSKYKKLSGKYTDKLQSQIDDFIRESVKASNPFVSKKDFEELRAKMEKLDKDLRKKSKK